MEKSEGRVERSSSRERSKKDLPARANGVVKYLKKKRMKPYACSAKKICNLGNRRISPRGHDEDDLGFFQAFWKRGEVVDFCLVFLLLICFSAQKGNPISCLFPPLPVNRFLIQLRSSPHRPSQFSSPPTPPPPQTPSTTSASGRKTLFCVRWFQGRTIASG